MKTRTAKRYEGPRKKCSRDQEAKHMSNREKGMKKTRKS